MYEVIVFEKGESKSTEKANKLGIQIFTESFNHKSHKIVLVHGSDYSEGIDRLENQNLIILFGGENTIIENYTFKDRIISYLNRDELILKLELICEKASEIIDLNEDVYAELHDLLFNHDTKLERLRLPFLELNPFKLPENFDTIQNDIVKYVKEKYEDSDL